MIRASISVLIFLMAVTPAIAAPQRFDALEQLFFRHVVADVSSLIAQLGR